MEIELDLTKTVDENATFYFEQAKKARRKIVGGEKALQHSKIKLNELKQSESQFWEKEELKKKKGPERKKEWYEKFHWFITSEGFLSIGGKDATSNELVIKKHTDANDLVFHTEMSGSPFFVLKDGQKATEQSWKEAAQATGVHSRAWKLDHTSAEVFYVKPEQLSKTPKSGEFISKGSFMIYGQKVFYYPVLEYALGLIKGEGEGGEHATGQIIAGPEEAVKSKTQNYVVIHPGREKKSDLARTIKAKLKCGNLDEINVLLPAGGGEIKK
ncbi:DUF814 domain-containing protein [Candidatus Woesearchaeota archaeon]|nr:DUF814 domain-containing protein [Candidatus Woesearchaeota archaeon]